jgi:hypothetical protein
MLIKKCNSEDVKIKKKTRSVFIIIFIPLFNNELSFKRRISRLRPIFSIFLAFFSSTSFLRSLSVPSIPFISLTLSWSSVSLSTIVISSLKSTEIVLAALFSLLLFVLRILHVHLGEKLPLEGFWKWLHMHIVAITTTPATAVNVLLAFGVCEICHRRKYCINFFASEKSSVDFTLRYLSIILVTVLNVNISNQMITQVINNNHVLYFTKLTHFLENILIESLKPRLEKKSTFIELFQHPLAWQDFQRWGQFIRDCFNTCVRVGQFRWWEVYYGFFRSCHRICKLRFCRRKDSWPCPFLFHRLWIIFRPFSGINL